MAKLKQSRKPHICGICRLRVNPEKCHLITTKSEDIVVNVKNNPIKNGTWQKLLGVKIDYKLTFNSYIDEIYKKAGQKMNVLSRIMAYMNIKKRRTLSNAFFISQFNLICQSRAKNNTVFTKDA